MNEIAILTWKWQAESALHTGYGEKMAEFLGRKAQGARSSVNLETHRTSDSLEPAFLASSLKGVFRSAAEWIVERTARELGETTYITCGYNSALDKQYHAERLRPEHNRFEPVTLLFGGTNCLPGIHDPQTKTALRRWKSRVRFHFSDDNDAFYGTAKYGPDYYFSWERANNKFRKALKIENLLAPAGVQVVVQVEESDPFALALLWLSSDLISSGAFRFGRFTSRGFGHVRLLPETITSASLITWLDDVPVSTMQCEGRTGYEAARHYLQAEPINIVRERVAAWLHEGGGT